MNRALCAGTLHYYVQSILNEVIDPPNVERLRNFFTQDVTGRGPLAAIRVGNQPYGILLTSVLARWAYPSSRELDRLPFDEYVRRVVVYLLEQWRSLQPKLSYITKSGNAHQGLMDVLGLQPTSADYYQRIGYTYDHVRNLEEFTWGGRYGLDLLLLWFEELAGREFLDRFGYRPQREDGSLKPVPLLLQLIYQHYHTRLDNQNLIDDQPLSEERSIKPYDEALAKNYIHWLIENSNNVDKLEEQDFGAGIARPNALLYMMLHNALLLEAKNSINSLLTRNEIVANELLRSRKFMNISSQPDISPWEVFRAPANRVVPNETSDRPLLEFVQFDRFTHGDEAEVGQHLGEAKDALGILASLPTARLERLLAEHIDTLNYRLDSWQMALFDRRLQQQRGLGIEDQRRRPGLYLGSYGYLENVRRAEGRRVKISEQEALPPELREGTDNLY